MRIPIIVPDATSPEFDGICATAGVALSGWPDPDYAAVRYLKAVLAGLLTSIIFGVCAFVFMARSALSQLERETGGIGAVSIGISWQVYLPLALGFALAARGHEMSVVSITENSGKRAEESHMTKPEISGIAPFFIVKNVPAAMSFYRDRLGFDIAFQGPSDDDIFFGIVQRGGAMIILKDIGVDPVPNYTRDIKKGIARWDAYLHVPDPDVLAEEFSSRNVEFVQPLSDNDDGLRGFEVRDADGYMLYFGRPNHS